MPYRIEVEKDPYFLQGRQKGKIEGIEEGIEKGIEKGKYAVVCTLLAEKTFSDAKIASLVGVSLAFVEKVKAELAARIE